MLFERYFEVGEDIADARVFVFGHQAHLSLQVVVLYEEEDAGKGLLEVLAFGLVEEDLDEVFGLFVVLNKACLTYFMRLTMTILNFTSSNISSVSSQVTS